MRQNASLLAFCGSLAAGEFLASLVPFASGWWPCAAIGALLSGLVGYGLAVPGWPNAAAALFGAALYFGAAEGDLERNRETPWMRGRCLAHCQSSRSGARAEGVRRELSRRIAIGLDERDEAVALIRAILLGERDDMPWRTKKLFVASGTMHVFAISGLHVMAIADVLSLLLAMLLVPRRLGGLLAVPLLWGYVTVIDFPPSAVRAAMMATFSLTAPLFWRRPNGLRSWCLAFLVVHVVNPLLVVNVGNVLSFVVMLALVLADELGTGLAQWQKTTLVTVIAWSAGLPISAHVFGQVTPGSMLANLVLIGTARLTVVVGAVGIASSYFSETLAMHLNNLTALGIRAMVFVAEVVARIPGANFETGTWGYSTCIEWYGALVLALFLFMRMRMKRGVLWAVSATEKGRKGAHLPILKHLSPVSASR